MVDIHRHCARDQGNEKDEARNMTLGQAVDSHPRSDKSQFSEGKGYRVCRIPPDILGVRLLHMDGVCLFCARNGTLYSIGKHSVTEPHPRPPRGNFKVDFCYRREDWGWGGVGAWQEEG